MQTYQPSDKKNRYNKDSSASLGMTIRAKRSLTFAALSFYFAPHHNPEPINLNLEPIKPI